MSVTKWGSLTGALLLAAGTGAGAPKVVMAQEPAPVQRAFQLGAAGARVGPPVQDLTPDEKTKSGVLVENVDAGGPAEKAGIKAADRITEFDGERVRSVRQFQRLVQESAADRGGPGGAARGGGAGGGARAPAGR